MNDKDAYECMKVVEFYKGSDEDLYIKNKVNLGQSEINNSKFTNSIFEAKNQLNHNENDFLQEYQTQRIILTNTIHSFIYVQGAFIIYVYNPRW